jgi:UDP-2,4-diacetamido-2,4,6-trideoxy-beta-L-altropyranose hydrolase
MRCLTLADALAERGATCTFFANTDAAITVPSLRRCGHRLLAHEDIATTPSKAFEWLVVDDYRLERRAEASIRRVAERVMIIDDLANREHDCDLLLDCTPDRRPAEYSSLVDSDPQMLLGAAYALVRPEFFAHRHAALTRRRSAQKPSRIFVSFGLVDPRGVTSEAVRELARAFPDLEIDVVLGPQAGSIREVTTMARDNPKIHLHVDPMSMSALMAQADLALGAGGSSTFERATLALPTVALVLADNQRTLTLRAADRGALTAIEGATIRDALDAIGTLIGDASSRTEMAWAAARLCDGLGVQRAVHTMLPHLTTERAIVRLRPATWSDADRIFVWHNEPRARTYSSDRNPPQREVHETWLRGKLRDPYCIMNIIEVDGTPAGTLCFDRRLNGSFMTSILVSTAYHGRGVGVAAVRTGGAMLCGFGIWAFMDEKNVPSVRMFTNAGFVQVETGKYFLANGSPDQ